ncbi:MAG: hypothetical protein R2837_02725 [Aliarcobacter sp.]
MVKETGLFEQIKNYKKEICAICGGYEMMFENLEDIYAIENEEAIKKRVLLLFLIILFLKKRKF